MLQTGNAETLKKDKRRKNELKLIKYSLKKKIPLIEKKNVSKHYRKPKLYMK